jgi:hypothetical protein
MTYQRASSIADMSVNRTVLHFIVYSDMISEQDVPSLMGCRWLFHGLWVFVEVRQRCQMPDRIEVQVFDGTALERSLNCSPTEQEIVIVPNVEAMEFLYLVGHWLSSLHTDWGT